MTTPAKLFKKPNPISEEEVSADRLPHLAKGLVRYTLKKVHAAQDCAERSDVLAKLLRATARVAERDPTLAGAIINRLPVDGIPSIFLHMAADAHKDDELVKQLREALLAKFPDTCVGACDYTRACDARAKEVWTRKTA